MKISSILPAALLAASFGSNMAIHAPKPATRKLEKRTELPNGADLSVSMIEPPDNFAFQLPSSTNTMDLRIHGNASVGLGTPDVTYIYVIDESGSTADPDGPCGTVLQCVEAFFKALNDDAIANGSAKQAAVITFNDTATLAARLQDPMNLAIEDAITHGNSDGFTNCTGALNLAAELVGHTNDTTIVVFAGDGACNVDLPNLNATVKKLADTGAIVHSVAVGEYVHCDVWNLLKQIPQNNGTCHSIQYPHDLPEIVNSLIGANLTNLELKLDGEDYMAIEDGTFSFTDDRNLTFTVSGNISAAFPLEGAIKIDFDTNLVGLTEGNHTICVRATGEGSLNSTKNIEECHQVIVSPSPQPTEEPTPSPTPSPTETPTAAPTETNTAKDKLKGWQIFVIVAAVVLTLVILAHGTKVALRDRKVDVTDGIEDPAGQLPGKDEAGGLEFSPVV